MPTDLRIVFDTNVIVSALLIKANCIVTGDKDLLVLHPFREIPILSPRAFLEYSLKEPRQVHEKRGKGFRMKITAPFVLVQRETVKGVSGDKHKRTLRT
jgi:hypothetical protein